MLNNLKTTVPGILTLVIIAWNAWQTKTISVPDVLAALAGIGLTQAKDWNITGGSIKQ